MRVIADLHLHSKYALATSRDLDLERLAAGAKFKGVNLLATGDFTHPRWQAELKDKLTPGPGAGLYSYGGVSWVLGTEVSTVYQQEGKTRKVHHLVFSPDLDIVAQIADSLSRHGRLASDGRPILKGLSSAELVERLTAISREVVVIPAHAWTPWFGVLGSRSGFDSLRECYGDMASRIFAIETGLSSDPPMNWRLSSLDGVSLISNSDAHSAKPWRLGREANVFEFGRFNYSELFAVIRSRDPARFLFTIEVDPAYGKYHYSGHSKCGVSLSPKLALREKGKCPACGKPLTVGVLQRVEELADRPEGYVPGGSVPYKRLLPLTQLVSAAIGVRSPDAKKVLEIQSRLVEAFEDEFKVLLDAPREAIRRVAGVKMADAVIAAREGTIEVTPGYDGIYGVPRIP
ncbi:MAG TPA: endonuclease Q family protein [Nitrososphaerales archaeon]|nr:endonuclease Q family protein [Nitrososphaerales archaeon]